MTHFLQLRQGATMESSELFTMKVKAQKPTKVDMAM
jgi:hypothetical protein